MFLLPSLIKRYEYGFGYLLGVNQPVQHHLPLSFNLFMPPNTQQQKIRLSKEFTSQIEDWRLWNDNQVEVVTLALKKFGILNKIRFQVKPTSAGRKITTQSTRQLI